MRVKSQANMSLEEEEVSESLFSYGTLQAEAVQLATFGRKLEGMPDALDGYRVTLIPIRDQGILEAGGETHYRNIQFTGSAADSVAGTVFAVSRRELAEADAYEEPACYKRVRVRLKSGAGAWVYLNSSETT